MLRLFVGMWEVQADHNHGHASVAMAPASKYETEGNSARENIVRGTKYGSTKVRSARLWGTNKCGLQEKEQQIAGKY
jgi:hypothetical protein